MSLPIFLLDATRRCEDAFELCDEKQQGREEIAKFTRQHLVNIMASLEQTGIDAALYAAIEAFDRRLEQEGLA